MNNNNKFIENCALALLELAIENKMIDEYLRVSNIMINLFKRHPLYIKLLSNTYISKEQRKKMLESIFFNKGIEVNILNTFFLLIDRELFSNVRLIFKQFRKLVNKINDIQYGNIFSVRPLSKEKIEEIQNKLFKKYNHNIKLINKIDLTLIGGVKIIIKNLVLDGSILGKLKAIKENILNDNDKSK